ncbi:hypothetical protein ACWENR_24640 [Micromonospora sp. NPDC004336]
MGEPDIRVGSLGQFKEFINDLGTTPKGLTAEDLGLPTLATLVDADFKELEYLHKVVDYQSRQLALFVEDVIKGYAGTAEIINFVGSNYFNAEMYSGQKLREPMSRKEADAANKAEIREDDGKPYDAHGWLIDGASGNQVDDLDFYHEQQELKLSEPIKPKSTDWADPGRGDWEKGDSGEAFRHVHYVFMRMKPELLTERSDRWAGLAKALKTAGLDLRQSVEELTDTWRSPAASSFRKRMQQAISSILTWADGAESRAHLLKSAAEVMTQNMATVENLKPSFDYWAQLYEDQKQKWYGAYHFLQLSDIAERALDYYDTIGIMLGNALSNALIHVADSWSAPPRYPGFTSDTPLPPPTAGPAPTGVPGGPGGGPPGAAGGPPGGMPRPGNGPPGSNPQKIVDGIRNKYEEAMKKQRKEYEKALKAQQDAAAKMKKQYEDALAKQRDAAAKQAEDLRKGLREAQQGVPPGLGAGPQGLDDALRQQQDLLDSLGTPPPSVEDLTRDLGRAMENVGLDPSAVSALPAYLNGLNGLGGPGAPGGPAVGLPGASNSPDLLGRGGATPTTTGLGASALTGRMTPAVAPGVPPGAGMGGMPLIPPMGGMPMGGGGPAPLSGRKNRPPLPGEETQKPAGRPRIVDPAGDGTTESRPARAGDRRAVVAQPAKAPEAEPGQALGRTA